MTEPDTLQSGRQPSAEQHYVVISLAGLVVMLLVLLQWRLAEWSFLPILLGLLGVVLRLRMTPLLTLILLAGLLLAGELTDQPVLVRYQPRGFNLSEWLLCGAVLALFAAQYRLQELTQPSLSTDTSQWRQSLAQKTARRPGLRPIPKPPYRSSRRVTSTEVSWLLLSLPLWAFLAQLGWRLLPMNGESFALSSWIWRGVLLAWLLVVSVLATAGLLSYLQQRRFSPRQARLYLQEALWQATSREQRFLSRALAQAHLHVRTGGRFSRWRRGLRKE
jgi:hypothetical protein